LQLLAMWQNFVISATGYAEGGYSLSVVDKGAA